jgi:tellurite resistance protein TerC
MEHPWAFWIGFHVLLFFLLYLDLHYFHRTSKTVSLKAALGWSAFWIGLALLFNGWIYLYAGKEKALVFFTGYLIEKSLSVDNIFVFLMIFSFFRIAQKYHHRVLYFGILGALILRISMILSGVALLEKFTWMFYIFGAFLCITALRFALQKEPLLDMKKSWILSFLRKHFRVTDQEPDGKFFIKQKGKIYMTHLFLALVMIEMADVVFAVDSIPAILAITTDAFIVYTSNVFAILGLRSLYFVLSYVQDQFTYLKMALAVILFFIGSKMLLSSVIHISTAVSLAFICVCLVTAILLSIRQRMKLSQRK